MPHGPEEKGNPWSLPGLGAEGPDPELRERLHLFGQFVGDWDIERWWLGPDGSEHRNRGHVWFRWILDGRAVQDVWSAIEGDPPVETSVGTTIRFYDAEQDRWTSLWIAPRYSALERFDVRRAGDEIVLDLRKEAGNLERWVFSDIRPSAFRWRAEESADGGTTWRLVEEMRIRRTEASGGL